MYSNHRTILTKLCSQLGPLPLATKLHIDRIDADHNVPNKIATVNYINSSSSVVIFHIHMHGSYTYAWLIVCTLHWEATLVLIS